MLRVALACAICASPLSTAQTLTQIYVPASPAVDSSQRDTTSRPFARVFADGVVRGGVTGENQSGVATGSLGIQLSSQLWTRDLDASFQVSVVGAADSVTGDYGAALLAPGSGTTLSAGLLDLRLRDAVFKTGIDIRTYASVSTSEWRVPVDDAGLYAPDGGTPRPFSTGVLGIGLLFGETLVAGTVGASTQVAVTFDAGVSFRSLLGDISRESNDAFRGSFLGTTRRRFYGIEGGLAIQINGVAAGITVYRFIDAEIDQFSDGQVVAGIGIKAPIVAGPLR